MTCFFRRLLAASADIINPMSLISVFCIRLVKGLASDLEPSLIVSTSLYSVPYYMTSRVDLVYYLSPVCYPTSTADAHMFLHTGVNPMTPNYMSTEKILWYLRYKTEDPR